MERKKLLVIDDDESIRRIWHTIFSRRDWDVEVAGTLADGLEKLDPALDCLILDLNLPDGDGEVVLRKVRDDRLKTRVVVTTGTTDAERLRVVREFDPDSVFVKPLNVVDVWWEGERHKAG